jgi:hypothetical protein
VIFHAGSFAVLARPVGDETEAGGLSRRRRGRAPSAPPFELRVLGYGPDGAMLAAQLTALLQGWEAAGRPSTGSFRILAYPRPAGGPPSPEVGTNGAVVARPHTTFVVAPKSET